MMFYHLLLSFDILIIKLFYVYINVWKSLLKNILTFKNMIYYKNILDGKFNEINSVLKYCC